MTRAFPAALALFALASCSEGAPTQPEQDSPSSEPTDPQDLFFDNLANLCGKAFAGRLTSDEAVDADMAGAAMAMHVRTCGDDEIRIPFHVETADGWDRSRTWVIRRTDTGLQLKHDHRHQDGSADAVTNYGGDTEDSGGPQRQSFPVDAESIALFQQEGLAASITNIWTVGVTPDQFTYELRRTGENARLFKVAFDLT
ncbi:MAG: hypothetical protein WA979_09160, partial [Pacificimonas sp.]